MLLWLPLKGGPLTNCAAPPPPRVSRGVAGSEHLLGRRGEAGAGAVAAGSASSRGRGDRHRRALRDVGDAGVAGTVLTFFPLCRAAGSVFGTQREGGVQGVPEASFLASLAPPADPERRRLRVRHCLPLSALPQPPRGRPGVWGCGDVRGRGAPGAEQRRPKKCWVAGSALRVPLGDFRFGEGISALVEAV